MRTSATGLKSQVIMKVNLDTSSPALCSLSKSFPASSTKDRRIQPHVPVARNQGELLLKRHQLQMSNSGQTRNSSEQKTPFTATCCFSLMVPHLLQHCLKIKASITPAANVLFTQIYTLITAAQRSNRESTRMKLSQTPLCSPGHQKLTKSLKIVYQPRIKCSGLQSFLRKWSWLPSPATSI